ncbi:hypothetical protein [Streptomyces benahoarensis]|uniref:Uncharacterized protein n=1 Tax=Streptomyces benahoarensis TaxID=2595054 RepID=A0A553ZMP2_9ACTN|nr:hypothetical protein [Streptomyces benahoarensis]TSB32012.1 hypothetical protein FNJ62_03795 [Streptomyces benahoarensis]TSB42738.1 hypothetical protein FNZ23_08340 [Streptomyces benahoarensis]
MDIELKTEGVACRVEGRPYAGIGRSVADARVAADQLKELARLHAEDDLNDLATVAGVEESLATMTALVRALEAWTSR